MAVVAPSAWTYASGGATSTIDYFLISAQLLHLVVGIRVVDTPAIKKHQPVELSMPSPDKARMMRVLVRQPRLELVRRQGCLPRCASSSVPIPSLDALGDARSLAAHMSMWLQEASCEIHAASYASTAFAG